MSSKSERGKSSRASSSSISVSSAGPWSCMWPMPGSAVPLYIDGCNVIGSQTGRLRPRSGQHQPRACRPVPVPGPGTPVLRRRQGALIGGIPAPTASIVLAANANANAAPASSAASSPHASRGGRRHPRRSSNSAQRRSEGWLGGPLGVRPFRGNYTLTYNKPKPQLQPTP
eukprot:scaffold1399_cov410-Prasinococcus_capsulatus_cf.AAC.4